MNTDLISFRQKSNDSREPRLPLNFQRLIQSRQDYIHHLCNPQVYCPVYKDPPLTCILRKIRVQSKPLCHSSFVKSSSLLNVPWRYRKAIEVQFSLPIISTQGVGGWSILRSGRFTSGKDTVPQYRRLGGLCGRCRRLWKISPQSELEPQTVQPLATRYTRYAIPAACSFIFIFKLFFPLRRYFPSGRIPSGLLIKMF